MRYEYLLVDLDDTLLDYRRAERLSLLESFAAVGWTVDERVCERFGQINGELWALKEKGELTRAQLRHQRFARLLPEVGLTEELADRINEVYSSRLRVHGETIPGAEKVLCSLHAKMKIAAVTNGVSAVQRSRLAQNTLLKWLDAVIISEEVGLHKPDPAILNYALKALSCVDAGRAVVLGDSLSADIAAANAAGIDSIWLSPDGSVSPMATYCVRTLEEAKELILTTK